MHCEEFMELDPAEQEVVTAQVLHLLRNDPESFVAMSSMIRSATQCGKFDGIKFGHEEVYADDLELVRFGAIKINV